MEQGINNNIDDSKKKKSIKKNYIYNLVYQLFAIVAPLITTPFISRVLGSSGVGQYSFALSIATYFVLIGSLGFGYYAQREIARFQSNKDEQSKVFFEILFARFASVLLSLLIHFALIFSGIYGEAYTLLMLIMSINILATAFDIAFLFQGNEEFGIIAVRNIVIKIIGVVVVFVFVRNESHVWLYTLCQVVILIISNLSLWTRLPKMITKVPFRSLNIKRHILPTLRLFVPTIAVSIYTVLDKTLIGFLVPGKTTINGVEKNIADIENGNYNQSEQIVKMAMTVITSLGTVMIPRNSNVIASGNYDAFKENVSKAIRFVFFLGMPLMLGLASVAFNFAPWFFGDGFDKTPLLIIMFSPLVIILGLSNVLGLQCLLPLKKDSQYTIALVVGACINLVLNLVFIPLLWSYGAAIATLIGELFVAVLMLVFAKNYIGIGKTILSSWKYFLCSAIMFGVVFTTQHFLSPSILHTLILIAEGSFIYFLLLLLFRDEMLLNFLSKTFGRLFKKKNINS